MFGKVKKIHSGTTVSMPEDSVVEKKGLRLSIKLNKPISDIDMLEVPKDMLDKLNGIIDKITKDRNPFNIPEIEEKDAIKLRVKEQSVKVAGLALQIFTEDQLMIRYKLMKDKNYYRYYSKYVHSGICYDFILKKFLNVLNYDGSYNGLCCLPDWSDCINIAQIFNRDLFDNLRNLEYSKPEIALLPFAYKLFLVGIVGNKSEIQKLREEMLYENSYLKS